MLMTRAEIEPFLCAPRIAVLATVDRRGWSAVGADIFGSDHPLH